MFTAEEIAKAAGGRLIGGNAEINGVSTDTRTIEKGMLFVAVRGENFDGNDYIKAAAEKGAAAVLCEREENVSVPLILVEDSRKAQLMLANYHRRKFPLKLVGITGSVGKTSTKDMVYAILSAKYKTLKTEGNFNNDIGLPKTLFRLDDSYKAAVIEMGMSDLGEISVLSGAAAPDICVITNIGWCHIENLKTRENILKAKLEILDGAAKSAPLILNGDDEYLSRVEIPDRKIIRYGFSEKCEIRAVNVEPCGNGERFTLLFGGNEYPAELPVVGEHHALNALAAFAVGIEAGMTPQEIIPAFMSYSASGMRQRIEEKNGLKIILDCYNASPDSMRASLSVLAGMSGGRRIAVLGDMLELGEMSAVLHGQIAEYVIKSADCAFLFGEQMKHCADALSEKGFDVTYGCDKAELAEKISSFVKQGDILLFKGSRGMKTEEIYEKIINRAVV